MARLVTTTRIHRSRLWVASASSVFSGADAQIASADCLFIRPPVAALAEEWTAAAVHLCGGISANPATGGLMIWIARTARLSVRSRNTRDHPFDPYAHNATMPTYASVKSGNPRQHCVSPRHVALEVDIVSAFISTYDSTSGVGSNELLRVAWGQTHIWNADGAFYIGVKDEKKTYVGLSYIHTPNMHILERAIRMAFKKPGMRKLSEVRCRNNLILSERRKQDLLWISLDRHS